MESQQLAIAENAVAEKELLALRTFAQPYKPSLR